MISLGFVVMNSLTGLVWKLIRHALKQPKHATVINEQNASVSSSFGQMAIIVFKWSFVIL